MRRWVCAALMAAACAQGPAAAVDDRPGDVAASDAPTSRVEMIQSVANEAVVETVAQDAPPLVAIDLDPARGSLREQLTLQASRAHRAGLRPYVQMRARWCAVCKRVDAQIAATEAKTQLRGVVILRVDTDIWSDELHPAGLVSPTIPTFYALDRRGRPTEELRGHGWAPSVDALQRVAAFVRRSSAPSSSVRRPG